MNNQKYNFPQDAATLHNIGHDFYVGKNGKPCDHTQAVKYFILAAKQGNAPAQSDLGVCYYKGIGVKKDLEEAVKYFRLAADQRKAPSQYNLGYCYQNGLGVKKDLDEAVKYFRLAAKQEFAYAKEALAKIERTKSTANQPWQSASATIC